MARRSLLKPSASVQRALGADQLSDDGWPLASMSKQLDCDGPVIEVLLLNLQLRYIDKRCVRAASLPEARGANVFRQHVRVSVRVEVSAGVAEPCTGRQGHHTRMNALGHQCTRPARTTRVEDPDEIAGSDSSRSCIPGMYDQRFGPRTLPVGERAFELAVELVTRLRRDEVERRGRCCRAQPF